MKRIKDLCLCATLAILLTPSSNAAIGTLEGPSFTTEAEIFLSVYDSASGASYTRDLGVMPGISNLQLLDLSFSPDALYLTTFADSDPANLRYSVVAVSAPFFDFSVQVWTTSNDSTIEFPTIPSVTLNAIFGGVTSYVGAVNQSVPTTDVAQNLSTVITDPTSAGHYTNPATFNESLASTVAFNTAAPIGTALAFYLLTEDSFTSDPIIFGYSPQWTLRTDGTLTFATPAATDTDDDGVADQADNCTEIANPGQFDGDGDGFGNACDTDLSNDCITNFIDLGLLRLAFFSTDAAADFNADGIVNFADLGIFRTTFLLPPGPSGVTTCN